MTSSRRVLHCLDEAGIAYCHWKSNDHLGAALDAETDLDVLVDPTRIDDVYRVFAQHSFRRARVAPGRNDVGLEDFLGIDSETERVVHFHVHYRLATGEPRFKRFRLPWERYVLDTRRRDGSGVWVTAPPVEVVLLLVRHALKLRARDFIVCVARRRGSIEHTERELRWLTQRSERHEIERAATDLVGDRGRAQIMRLVDGGISITALRRLRRSLRHRLVPHTAARGPVASARRFGREALWTARGVSRRIAPRPHLLGRGGPAGGLLVAFVGCDGAGKSTLARDVQRLFAAKLDVYPVYLGSGDGSSSFLRRPMKATRDRLFGDAKTHGRRERKRRATTRHPRAMSVAKVAWAIALAAEKRRKLTRAMRARTRGLVVVCDRWPQRAFPGELDGPRLDPGSSVSRRRGLLARYEMRPYDLAERFPPDLVIRLDVDEETAATRRPGSDRAYLERRIEIVRALRFDGSLHGIVDVDANRPYEKVLADVVREIWSRL